MTKSKKLRVLREIYILSDFDLKIGTGGDVLVHVRKHFPFYIERDRFVLMSGRIEAAAALEHRLTFEKPVATDVLWGLLTGNRA